jgi:hypothetical protein
MKKTKRTSQLKKSFESKLTKDYLVTWRNDVILLLLDSHGIHANKDSVVCVLFCLKRLAYARLPFELIV